MCWNGDNLTLIKSINWFEHVFKLPFCIISRNFQPSPRNPLPLVGEGKHRGFVLPGIGIIRFGLPNSEEPFQTAVRRSCLPAGCVCSKLHASLCGFPNGPSQSPFTAVRTFRVVFSRDYLWTCPLIAAQGCVHVRLVPVCPINGHMLPAFGETRLVAPSWRLFASDFINFLLHYSFLLTSSSHHLLFSKLTLIIGGPSPVNQYTAELS